jgi:hypothetical protein
MDRAWIELAMVITTSTSLGCARAVADNDFGAADAAHDSASTPQTDSGHWTQTDSGGGGIDDTGTPWTYDAAPPPPDAQPQTPSVCNGKSRILTTADKFIADFESTSLTGWYDYRASGALNALVVGTPGAIGTAKAGHLAASGLTDFGAGMGFGTGCWDTSALDGISFWAKGTAGGDNRIQFQVAIPATHAAANGGDCVTKCFDHPSKQLVLTSDWKQYVVAWSELTQAGFGTPAHYQGVIMALNWVSVSATSVDFWIDEVGLYSGSASPNPVGGGVAPQDSGAAD